MIYMKPAASRLLHALAIAVFATMVLLAPSTASAQEARGTISGKVRDASDAVMPGVSVRITDAARGTTVNATTNDAGLYQATYLLPGTYQIVVEVNGFKKYVRGGIALRIGDNLDIPVQLEVGQTSETVTVTAETPTLDTTSGSMGQTVDSRRAEHGHGQRQRGDRVVRAAHGHHPGIQSPDRDLRRPVRQHRRRRDQHQHQVGHEYVARHGLLHW